MWSRNAAATYVPSKARMPTLKSKQTGQCATVCWSLTTNSRFASQVARATSTKARFAWRRTAFTTSPPWIRDSPCACRTISSSRRAKRTRRTSLSRVPGTTIARAPSKRSLSIKADDEFGIYDMTLHYSVNGGAEQTVDLLKQKGVKQADGSTVISLENF